MGNRKIFRRITAAAAALAVICAGSVPIYAQEKTLTADDIVDAIHKSDLVNEYKYRVLHTDTPASDTRNPVVDVSGQPSKFDLRDVDGKSYVSEVKDQTPWGTCWAFGTISAAETSIAYDYDHDYNTSADNDKFDLSELHMAWFVATPLPKGCAEYPSQIGEGRYFFGNIDADDSEITNKTLNYGGANNFASILFSAGMGPVLESTVPYEKTSDENYDLEQIITVSFSDEGIYDPEQLVMELYREKDYDFDEAEPKLKELGYESVDYDTIVNILDHIEKTPEEPLEEYRNKKIYFHVIIPSCGDWSLDESQRFMSAFYLKNVNMLPSPALSGINDEYIFNQTGIDAIKSELLRGRAVSVLILSDYSMPADLTSDEVRYLNFFDKNGVPTDDPEADIWAHYVYDGEYDPSDPDSVNKKVDANHCVCIVGYDDDFPKEYFNDPNGTIDGDGAFIVKNSWGDEDWGNGASGYFWISYYDQSLILPTSLDFDTDENTREIPRDTDMYDFNPAATQYTAEFDDDVRTANVFEAKDNCSVRFVGFETAKAATDVEFSVYLLDEDAKTPVDGVLLAEASEHYKYAGYHTKDIGCTAMIPAGRKYSVVVRAGYDGKSIVSYSEDLNYDGVMYYDIAEVTRGYAKTVVNPGESFVGSGDTWTDWTEIIGRLEVINEDLNNNGYDYDNFPIRSYTVKEPVTVINSPVSGNEVLQEGDVIKGKITVTNTSGKDFAKDVGFEITLSLGDIGKNNEGAKFCGLKADETKTINYSYTVTADDIKTGKIDVTADLKWDGMSDDDPVFGELRTFTISTEPTRETEPKPVDTEETNPATGVEAPAAAAAFAVLTILLLARKRRKS
ncbi:MAG: hypothetical protein II820_07270 [Ruminiclostridium sp.]|nr:hypothetical protein [Ruminiclostridium sp.]